MLRYQLYDCNAEKIAIEKELVYLNNYVKLQQLRREENYEIKMEINPNVSGFSITPLLLIAFVENAFKHISNHADNINFVHICMSKKENVFLFKAVNSKDNSVNTDNHTGIGLANVKRRLELIYPGSHSLVIDDTAATFTVQLQITIDN